jgi:ATP-dependent helicase/nuclease subunit B
VADTARLLMRELGEERRRIAAGAPMPALGEGRVCDTCEARGLCRRDHW